MTPEDVEAWLGTEDSRRAVADAGEPADRDGRHVARRYGKRQGAAAAPSHWLPLGDCRLPLSGWAGSMA
jgi:hypothetical protein